MHPTLWQTSGGGYAIPSYGFMMVVGFVLAIWLSVRAAKRVGADPSVVTTMVAIGGLTGMLGSRGMHLVHYYWDRLVSGRMDAGDVVSTMAGGGEILGGVVLGSACVMIYLAIARKSIRLYLDVVFPQMILAMAIGRVGCLLFGCCWGQVCQTEAGDRGLLWAVRFPYGSPAHWTQWADDRLSIPDDLLWRPLGADQPQPFPQELLNDTTLATNTDLAGYVTHLEAVASLKDAGPDDPELSEHRKRMQALEPVLPGRNIRERARYVGAAIHLHRLAARDGVTPQATLANLRVLADTQQSLWVHPTQIYDAVGLTILFVLLSAILYRRRRPGMVVAWTMVLYSISRFLMEMIRGDNPHDVFRLTVSQFISLLALLVGLILMLVLRRCQPSAGPTDASGE